MQAPIVPRRGRCPLPGLMKPPRRRPFLAEMAHHVTEQVPRLFGPFGTQRLDYLSAVIKQ